MLPQIRVLEIIRNALFCSLCNFIKYVFWVEAQTGSKALFFDVLMDFGTFFPELIYPVKPHQ